MSTFLCFISNLYTRRQLCYFNKRFFYYFYIFLLNGSGFVPSWMKKSKFRSCRCKFTTPRVRTFFNLRKLDIVRIIGILCYCFFKTLFSTRPNLCGGDFVPSWMKTKCVVHGGTISFPLGKFTPIAQDKTSSFNLSEDDFVPSWMKISVSFVKVQFQLPSGGLYVEETWSLINLDSSFFCFTVLKSSFFKKMEGLDQGFLSTRGGLPIFRPWSRWR